MRLAALARVGALAPVLVLAAKDAAPRGAVLATVPGGGASTLHFVPRGPAPLAGFADGEVFLSRVGPDGADLAALPLDPPGAAPRPLARVPPFARDFSVDERGRLVYGDRRGDAWAVERIDRHGAQEVLA